MFRTPTFQGGHRGIRQSRPREYEDDWGDATRLDVRKPDGTPLRRPSNEEHREESEGHLLLAHGTMDDNVRPTTLLVVERTDQSNKDFDLLYYEMSITATPMSPPT